MATTYYRYNTLTRVLTAEPQEGMVVEYDENYATDKERFGQT